MEKKFKNRRSNFHTKKMGKSTSLTKDLKESCQTFHEYMRGIYIIKFMNFYQTDFMRISVVSGNALTLIMKKKITSGQLLLNVLITVTEK